MLEELYYTAKKVDSRINHTKTKMLTNFNMIKLEQQEIAMVQKIHILRKRNKN